MKNAGLFTAMGVVAPQFLTQTVEGATQSIAGFENDHVLVVVQLGGGNDGLNTVVPYSNDHYYNLRPRLGIKKEELLPLNNDIAFTSKMAGMKSLYDNGQLAVVQGIGYPNPDRSHFRSMEIWQTASDSDAYESSGWIGRYFDHECSGSARPQVGVAIGKERPQAFDGTKGYGVAFEDPAQYGWVEGNSADNVRNFTRINDQARDGDSNIDFLRHVTSNAIMSSREIQAAAEKARLSGQGRRRPINKTMTDIAAMIKHELATRIYYVSASGFDTHVNQMGQHGNLWGQISDSLAEFQAQLRKDGTAKRVVTLVFSEFGRRVQENESGGTDHGTAAPLFLMGDDINAGLHGTYPSLTDLDQGDLKYTVDFREVYATLLEQWFEVDSVPILGRQFPTGQLLA
jgi:uncharacterized protein (DUF1501 family)